MMSKQDYYMAVVIFGAAFIGLAVAMLVIR